MIYSLGQNIVYPRYQKRKIGKRLHTHKCYEPNKSVTTVMMNAGNGGITGDGDIIQGGGDTAFFIEHRMTQQQRWKLSEDDFERKLERMINKLNQKGIGVDARTSTQNAPNLGQIER